MLYSAGAGVGLGLAFVGTLSFPVGVKMMIVSVRLSFDLRRALYCISQGENPRNYNNLIQDCKCDVFAGRFAGRKRALIGAVREVRGYRE